MSGVLNLDPRNEKVCAYEPCGQVFRRPKKVCQSEWVKRKYCSRVCGGLGSPYVAPAGKDDSRCRSGKHEMTPENSDVDAKGRKRCKACRRTRESERYRRNQLAKGRVVGEPKQKRAPKSKPAPPPPPPQPSKPAWRPPGWSDMPNTWAGHRSGS